MADEYNGKCPQCGDPEGTIIQESVDIGVGTQYFTVAAECSKCGQMTICNECGSWSFQRCRSWCGQLIEDEAPF